jgi:hypothetical protein
MPNWCYNRLSVTGDRESLVKLTEAITRKHDSSLAETTMSVEQVDYDLTVLFPVPEPLAIRAVIFNTDSTDPEHIALLAQYAENKAKFGVTNWYDWCVDNWGTKWSPRIQEWEIIDHSDGSGGIYAYYETAWSPADGLIREVSKQFPTLLFIVTSDEEGRSFACVSAFSNGEMVAEAGCELYGDKVPAPFREAYARIDKEIETGTSDDGYDAWDEMSELDSDILGWLETEVSNQLRGLGLLPKVGV